MTQGVDNSPAIIFVILLLKLAVMALLAGFIARFGRFPHRNAILGRESTPEEIEFLKQPGSRF